MGKVLSLLMIMSVPCLALQTYPLIDQQHLSVSISKEHPNRIAVQGDRIKQVFGMEQAFELQTDDESGQIFVKCQHPVTLTIVTEAGITQDITLKPDARAFQSIVLKPQMIVGSHEKAPPISLPTFMKTMLGGRGGERLEETIRCKSGFHLAPQRLYRDGSFEGKTFTLSYTGGKPVILRESAFFMKGLHAIYLSKKRLEPGDSAQLILIRRGS